jgi:mono/diheme cytochrome c family protein
MSSHAPRKSREFSHPVLWTAGLLAAAGAMGWTFFHWLDVGMRHGRDAGAVSFAPAAPAKPVDHPALIADRSQAVLDRGQQLYSKNCASCHGPNGDQNVSGTNPAPRNLHTEAYKAEWGGGPHGFFLTLTKGWGQGMPGFTNLDAADRYAVVHFVRETWQKGKPIYAEADLPATQALIPQPGAAAASGPRTPPHLVEQHARLHPLLALTAREGAARADQARAWITQAAGGAETAEARLLRRAASVSTMHAGWLITLHEAAVSGDRARVIAALISPDSGDPSFALEAATSIDAAAGVLVAAAGQKA